MNKSTRTVRWTSVLLAALLAVVAAGVIALGASQAEAASNDPANPTVVNTWDDLKTAVTGGGYIKLGDDLEATDPITISADTTIEGGGFAIYRSMESATAGQIEAMFQVAQGTLTLGRDLTLDGRVFADKTGSWTYLKSHIKKGTRGFFVEVQPNGKLVIDGATLQNYKTDVAKEGNRGTIPEGVSPVYVQGDFEMTSGTIQNNYAGATSIDNLQQVQRVRNNTSLTWEKPYGTEVDGTPINSGYQGVYAEVTGWAAAAKNAEEYTLQRVNAGAIYFDGDASKTYKIGGTAKLTNNAGHSGAIVVKGGTLTIDDNAEISENWGDFFGSVWSVSSDAVIKMCGGTIKHNTGASAGGVFVSRDGSFFLMGGTIEQNVSRNCGGGILVYSDKVYLLSGTIKENNSAVFGGGIYVYGDDNLPKYQYTLTMHTAEITNNHAVKGIGDAQLGHNGLLAENKGFELTAAKSDEALREGSGGGVWLCPAGVTEFNASAINLYNNTAENQGKDFHKDAGYFGGVLIDFGPHVQLADSHDGTGDWIHDEMNSALNGKPLTVIEATSGEAGRLSVFNETKNKNVDDPQLFITDNTSRRGGGVGSNGSVLFIEPSEEDKNVDKGNLSYQKIFKDVSERPMEYDVILANANGEPIDGEGNVLDNQADEVVITTFRLYDKNWANAYDSARKNVNSPLFNQGKATWSKGEGVESNTEAANYSAINIDFAKGENGVNFFQTTDDEAELNVIIREYEVNGGNRGAEVSERFFSYSDPEFKGEVDVINKKITAYAGGTCTDQGCDCDPGEAKTFTFRYRTFKFDVNAQNQETPEIEKYVEEAVHKDIALDEEFTYNILAYVTSNADEVVITDKLHENLAFVSDDPENVKVYDLGTTTSNGMPVPVDSNHLPVYSVSGEKVDNASKIPSVTTGTAIDIKDNDYSKVAISGDTLTVTLANKLEDDGSGNMVNSAEDQELAYLRGHYIRIEFKAKIKDDLVAAIKAGSKTIADDLSFTEIKADTDYQDGANGNAYRGEPYTGNDPVVSSEDHTGIANTASYTIKVGNKAKYQDTSNTVTVKPGEQIEKYINKDVDAHLIEFDRAFTYDILAYVPGDADKVEITDTLVDSLEFSKTGNDAGEASTNPAEVVARVAVKEKNDHTPKSTVSDADADNSPVVLDAADYTAKISGQTLTITLDDQVSIDATTGLKTRQKDVVKNSRGKWIQVSFYAKYTDDAIKNAATNPPADNADVADNENGSVASDVAHDGTKNQAGYKVFVDNESTAKYESLSNIVTHDAETATLNVKKTWSEGEWPADAKAVFGIYADAESTVPVKGTIDATTGAFTTGSEHATIELNSSQKELTITGLPKLINTTYTAKELSVNGKEVVDNVVAVSDTTKYFVGADLGGTAKDGFTATVNNEKVETEKYVNNDVHADLVEYDKVFKYDILTYVSKDATEVTITDPLVSALEFAKKTDGDLTVKAEATALAADTVESVVAKDKNDHTPNSTVSGMDEDNEGTAITPTDMSIENNTLTIKFVGDDDPDNAGQKKPVSFAGKWLQVTFYAKYTQDVIDAANAGDYATVVDNGAVLSDNNNHAGTKNQAAVSMTVKNGAKADLKTNEVTVTAETITVEAEKQWKNADGSAAEWPEDVSEVQIDVLNDAEVVDTIKLTKNAPKASSKELPKLVGVTYALDEATQVPGWIVSVDGSVVTNTRSEGTQTEKYVNKDVTWDFDNFDQVFTYDVLAYVTRDATKLTVTDTLNGLLEFANPANLKVANLGASNDHKTTVKEDGEAIALAEGDVATAADGKVNVKLGEDTTKALRGNWVKISFDAQIKAEKYADVAELVAKRAEGANWAKVAADANGNVQIEKAHDGIPNKASFTLETANNGTFELDTNTVTVEPKTTEITVSKEWIVQDEAAEWPAGATVEVKVIGKDGAEVAKDTLSSDKKSATFSDLPLLEGVTYAVEEGTVTGADGYAFKAIEGSDGSFTITNEYAPTEEPKVEKYVNDDVHQNLVEFDRPIKYDILAYVTSDAQTVTISDQLVASLEFADGTLGADVAAQASLDAAKVVTAVQVKDDNDHKVGGTVSQAGVDATGYKAEFVFEGRTLQLSFDDAKAAGIQGKWVQVTFWAKYTDAVIEAVKIGDVKKVTDNGNVLNGAAEHEGTLNQASYNIRAENGYNYGVTPTNVVTVEPEAVKVPAEKQWKNADGSDASWPSDIESVQVQVLGKGGAVVDTITLASGKTKAESKALPKLIGVVYTLKEQPVAGYTSVVDGNTVVNTKEAGEVEKITVSVVKKWVGAKADEIPTPAQFKDYLVLKLDGEDVTKTYADKLTVSDEGGFSYTAAWTDLPAGSYTVEEAAIEGFASAFADGVFTNTKTREEKPEIEKYIDQDVHRAIEMADVFTYDIVAYVTKDADVVVVSDTLNDVLDFACTADEVAVADLGADDNHKTNGSFTGSDASATVAQEGSAVASTATIDGKTLTVTIDDATAQRGHWVRVSFKAKVAAGKSYADVKAAYAKVSATAAEERAESNVGNAPVISNKDHEGVPNAASYDIYLRQPVLDENGKPKLDEEGKPVTKVDEKPTYGDKSNTVTVRPTEQFDVTISKTDLGGTEIEGAHIVVTDEAGNVVDEWDSTTSAHELSLKPGRYTMKETVAPEGFEQVTTDMVFEVSEDGTVTLLTSEVNGGGRITAEGNHIDLSDAPLKFPVEISKADITTSSELPGATIKITDAEGNKIDEWTSGTEPHKLVLPAGEYTLEEVNAPEGYDAITTKVRFRVGTDGSVTVLNAEEVTNGQVSVADANHLILSDMPNKFLSASASVVEKIWNDGGNTKDRKAVTFQLQYKIGDGAWTNMEGDGYRVTISEPNAEGAWTASFSQLPAKVNGQDVRYRAVEANQAGFAGFYTAGDADEDIVIVGTGDDGHGMSATNHPNKPSTEVLISKRAVGGGDELPGATIQIIDANGNVIHEFVSGTEPTSFTLAPGVYTLREITAPDGYEKTEDMSFRVNVDGTVECLKDGTWVDVAGHVVMEDAPSPEDEGGEKPKNPEGPTTPSTPKTTAKTTPTTSASATPRTTTISTARSVAAKTGDSSGVFALGLGLAAAAAFAAGAWSLRRRNQG